MDRLDSAARLMIVSDLDSTMVDHDDPENVALLRFNALWEAYYRHDSLLVFSTGRSPTHYQRLRRERPLLTPDITVFSVGTEIMYGESEMPDNDWLKILNMKWDRNIVVEETTKYPQLVLQSETEQRPHKVSFDVDKVQASEIIKSLSKSMEKRGLDVKIIYSGGIALDVLPKGAGKGEALAYLSKKFQAAKKVPVNTLVCGDSGNDAELFTIPDVYGVMVSNAQEELLQWHSENARNNPKIIHGSERCAAAIIEAIGYYDLGPKTSPRDDVDIFEIKKEPFSPGHEVVKFYVFYEKWRRADVQKSQQTMHKMLSMFYQSGTYVNPFGEEESLKEYVTKLEMSYGNKKGTNFQVWLDRVSAAQVSTNSWLVKFDKWVLSGEERYCCPLTVLISSKYAEVPNDKQVPNGFLWMHVNEKG